MSRTDELIERLRGVLGPEGILTGAGVHGRAAGIWRNDTVQAAAIFRPADTREVAALLAACHAAGQSVVTHGGLTGLAEGAVAGPADVVLSTERMRAIESVDTVDRTMLAQAGVTLQAAQTAAAAAGLMVGLDLGARGSCTLGGNVATNAGGNRVIRYGMARDSILGLEAVLADGTVVSSLNSMLKNNAGYDLKQLFIGTEGTLGVVTRVVLRLRPAWQSQNTALLACTRFADVTALLALLDRQLGGRLSAYEVLWREYYELVAKDAPPLPAGHEYYVLAEALGSDQQADQEHFTQALALAESNGLIRDALICQSGRERERVWAMRDNVELTLQHGPSVVFDVSLPLSRMEGYVRTARRMLQEAWGDAHRCWVFGHAGDGNLHFVVAAGNGSDRDRERIERCIYEPLRSIGGSISGEHGIGLEKKAWLHVSRSESEIALMRTLKRALDPRGILNPGRVFDMSAGPVAEGRHSA